MKWLFGLRITKLEKKSDVAHWFMYYLWAIGIPFGSAVSLINGDLFGFFLLYLCIVVEMKKPYENT